MVTDLARSLLYRSHRGRERCNRFSPCTLPGSIGYVPPSGLLPIRSRRPSRRTFPIALVGSQRSRGPLGSLALLVQQEDGREAFSFDHWGVLPRSTGHESRACLFL